MSHVQIRTGDGPGTYQIIVDGVDMSHDIMKDGFAIALGDGELVPATVQMVVAADTLNIDLPEAVIEALRADKAGA